MRVAVVGGGAIGASCALDLARRGAEVVLADSGRAGGGASQAAAGMLAPFSESERPDALFSAGSRALLAFPEWLAEVERRSGINVGLVRAGTLHVARSEASEVELRRRLAWWSSCDAGAGWLDAARLHECAPHLAADLRGGVVIPSEMQVDAARYALALPRAARSAGVDVREGQRVTALHSTGSRVHGLTVASETVEADAVVLATGADAALAQWFGLPVHPVKGEIVRLLPRQPLPQSLVFAPGGYLTPRPDGSVLVGASAVPHRSDPGVGAGTVGRLLAFALDLAPVLAEADFAGAWSGQRPAVADHLPVIGPVPGWEGLWVATGHHRNGILLSQWTAETVAAGLLEGARPPVEMLPDRLLLSAAAVPTD